MGQISQSISETLREKNTKASETCQLPLSKLCLYETSLRLQKIFKNNEELFMKKKKKAIRKTVIYSLMNGSCQYQIHSYTISFSSLTQP